MYFFPLLFLKNNIELFFPWAIIIVNPASCYIIDATIPEMKRAGALTASDV